MTIGPIIGCGALAMLIPPSILAVILATLIEVSVGAMLIGGILPGLVLDTLYAIYIVSRAWIQPDLAPPYDLPSIPLAKKIKDNRRGRTQMNRRDFLHNAAVCVLLERQGQRAQAADSGDRFTIAASKGRQFLVSLFDPAIGLLPGYRDARVFWLFHDNYLAAKVLEKGRSDLSLRLQKAIRNFGVTESGKIEIIFDEAKRPLPFRQPELIQVKQLGEKTIKTEVLTDRESKGWEDYADLLLGVHFVVED